MKVNQVNKEMNVNEEIKKVNEGDEVIGGTENKK